MRCATIQPDGQLTIGRNLTFKECQQAVGGYVQLLSLRKDCCVYVNEEGLIHNLDPNELGHRFVTKYAPETYIADRIRGTVVVVGGVHNNGHDDLPEAYEQVLKKLYSEYMSGQGLPLARSATVEKLIEFAGQFNEEIHLYGIEHDYVRGQIDLIMDAAGLPMEDEFRRDVFDAICVASDKFFRSGPKGGPTGRPRGKRKKP